jgi:hypothetical protein
MVGVVLDKKMNIAEGIKLKGRPAEIPDCSRDDLPEFFRERGYKAGAEIGVCRGEYTEILAKSGLKIYAIDPWRAYAGFAQTAYQKKIDYFYEQAQKTLAPYANCSIIRKTSMEALRDFADASLDFVYIDGNHSFQYVAADICEWTKKVRRGGIISGHDYIYANPRHFHVHYVVDAYAAAYGIDFWVLGRKKPLEGEKRDKSRSWLWINL